MAVEQTTRTGVYLWSDDTDAFTRSQMTDSHESIEERVATFFRGTTLPTGSPAYERSLFLNTATNKLYYFDGVDESGSWQELNISAINPSVITAKGDILAGLASSSPTSVPVGANNAVLIADSSQTAGLRWASTLAGLTLSAPTLNTPTVVNPLMNAPREVVNFNGAAAGGAINIDILTASIWYYSGQSSTNVQLNFRGNSISTLNAYIPFGQSVTVLFGMRNGSTAYRPTAFSIDGVSQTIKWQGGTQPNGNPNSNDIYVFTIIKSSASSPVYEVLGSQARYS